MLQSIRPLIALLLFPLLFSFSSFSESLRILHFNDVYEIMPQSEGAHNLGGLAPLKTLIEKYKKFKGTTFVTFGGDIRPATVDGNPMGSIDMIQVLNGMDINFAVFGNHEFDEGDVMTREFIKQANFPWVSSNILDKHHNPYGGSPRYVIQQVGRYKVGLIGLLTPETTALSSPGLGVFFAPAVQTAKEVVSELKEQGVDVIIALTHLSIDEDKDLAAKVPEIDLIVGGHDHEPTTLFIGGTMIHKSGSNGEYLGVVDLEITKDQDKVHVLPEWKMVPVKKVKAHSSLNKQILALRDKASKEFEQPIALTQVHMDSHHATVRSKQSAFGSLVADALRIKMKADVGLINGGSLRGNNYYPAGSQILLKHISNELSFTNTVVVREITGAQLKQILEAALEHTPEPNGSFPHVSGFEVVYDSSKPKGQKVVYLSRNGNEVLKADTLRLATTDFIASGGDGLPDISRCKGLDTDIMYGAVTHDYLVANAVITEDILKPRVMEKSAPEAVELARVISHKKKNSLNIKATL